jgi:hypothetical protein
VTLISSELFPHGPPPGQIGAPIWAVRITHLEAGQIYGALPRAAPHRFRYITLTLEYLYRGMDCTDLYPESIVLVCFGCSPLQGLAQPPLLFFDEDAGRLMWPDELPLALSIDAGMPHRATLVYEFHEDCREFRLYFPECDGIGIECP